MTTPCTWTRERIVSPTVLLLLVATALILPRFLSGIEDRLILAGASGSGQSAPVDSPARLGSLQPKGRVAPDGSEVWGYPEGSGLEEVIEVHVKNGRVVREVLRPSAISSAHSMADELSLEEAQSSGRSGR